MINNPQVSLSEDPCMAAGELVMSQCPICHTCSVPWWCKHGRHKHEQKQTVTVFMKFENIDIDGLLARTGLSKFMSVTLIAACVVAGTGFALVWRRTGATQAIMSIATEDQVLEGYADPLCTLPNGQDFSE